MHNGRILAENNVVYTGAAELNNLLQSGASLHFIIPVNSLTDYEKSYILYLISYMLMMIL